MARKKFTEEEMNHLRTSPYVLDVSPSIVHFSAEFKERFYLALLEGREPWNIVIELGVDADILGATRVVGLKSLVRNEVKAGKGFRDIETYGKYLEGKTTPEGRIRQLEQQLTYKDQEIEYLKKIVSLCREEPES